MSRILIAMTMLMVGCAANNDLQSTDEEIKQLKESNKEIARQLRVIDCEHGILAAIDAFKDLLYKKVSKEQLDAAWKTCEDVGK